MRIFGRTRKSLDRIHTNLTQLDTVNKMFTKGSNIVKTSSRLSQDQPFDITETCKVSDILQTDFNHCPDSFKTYSAKIVRTDSRQSKTTPEVYI